MPPAWIHSASWFRWRFVSPFLRLIVACFNVFCSDSVAVWGFAFFMVCWLQFATLLSWSLGFSSSHWCCCYAHRCCSHFHSLRFLAQILLVHCRRQCFCRIRQRQWQSLFEAWWFSLSYPLSWWWAPSLFFADLIPGIFFTPVKSSSVLWMSCCLFILFCVWYIFYAFAYFFQALFLFFTCASSLLDESSDFNVFLWNLLSLFRCCCLACFFIVFFFSFMSLLTCNTTEPASSSECAHRAWCSPPTMWPDSSFTVLRSSCLYLSPAVSTASFSMVSVDVPSTPSASASAFSFSITISVCSPFAFVVLCIVFVLSPVSSFMSCSTWSVWNTMWPATSSLYEVQDVFHLLLLSSPRRHSSWFLCTFLRLLLLPLQYFQFFASAAAISFFACASASLLSACAAAFFCGGGFSFDFFNDLLVSFFELRLLNFNVFHCLVSPSCFIISCFPLIVLSWLLFPGVLTVIVAMTHLWSLPMWIMSLARRFVCFWGVFSVHRVESCVTL